MPDILDIKNGTLEGSFEYDPESPLGQKKTITFVYLVRADSISQTEDEIASVCPPLLSFLRGTRLKKKTPKEIDASALLWEVTCEYDTETSDQGNNKPTWSWSSETVEEVQSHDAISKAPVVNSAGTPILVTKLITVPILTISRLENTFSPNTILQYENKVNATPFWGAPAKTAWLASITDDPEEKDGVTLRRVKYVIKFYLEPDPDTNQLDGWISKPLNHGPYYLKQAGLPDTLEFQDLHKNPTTGNLNGDGTKRSPLLPALYLKFNRYQTVDFNNLQLGPFFP